MKSFYIPATLDLDERTMGPAMARLTERQRAFVRLMLQFPAASLATLAKLAGYGTPTSKRSILKQIGYNAAHSERVLAAVQEETRKTAQRGALVGIAGLIEIAADKKSPDRLRACVALADRGGFAPKTEHKVVVAHDIDEERMFKMVDRLASELGIRREKLVGPNLIEGKVTKPH